MRRAVDLLEALGRPGLQDRLVRSGRPAADRAASPRTGKPMIISTGMANADEIGEAVGTARENGCEQIVLLHCVSSLSGAGRAIERAHRAGSWRSASASLPACPIIRSDRPSRSPRSRSAAASSRSTSRCARADGGPDAAFSLEPDEFTALVQDCKRAWRALGRATYDLQGCERGNRRVPPLALRRARHRRGRSR